MSPKRQALVDAVLDPDSAYNRSWSDLEPLRIEAAQELFAERREQIPLVARRAEEAGIKEIRSLQDLVPLLFAHTAYKSYPQSFIDHNRWDRMLQWLNTLSVEDTTKVDVSGVKNVDDWIERLWANGHMVMATSGSSGKVSFLNHTRRDQEGKKRHFRHTVGWPYLRATNTYHTYWAGPARGPNSAIEASIINAENWSKPGCNHVLTEEPLRIAEVSRAAALRTRIAEGSASPTEIKDFEAQTAAKARQSGAALRALIDDLLDRRHEPIFITGMWAQHMAIIARARERGIGDGEFHCKSVVNAGGGVKGIALPHDYKEQVDRFYGNVVRPGAYGMTEMAQLMPRCEAGRYHCAPGLIALVVDGPGERLVSAEDSTAGLAEGRFAFLDLLYDGRWGGVITGDKVTVDFAERCACGRYGPTLLDSIARWAQPGAEDHIGCAGTIDSYVRGALEEQS